MTKVTPITFKNKYSDTINIYNEKIKIAVKHNTPLKANIVSINIL